MNTFRPLDILIFNLASDIKVKNTIIEAGWNQLIRNKDTYFIRKISTDKHYTELPVSHGHLLLEKLTKNIDPED